MYCSCSHFSGTITPHPTTATTPPTMLPLLRRRHSTLTTSLDRAKRLAATRAVRENFSPAHNYIGIGSGSTVVHVVSSLLQVATANTTFVPTGYQSRSLLLSAGLRVALIDEVPPGAIDIAFDGADEVDPAGNCVKGGGACLLMEKLVAVNAGRFVVVAGE